MILALDSPPSTLDPLLPACARVEVVVVGSPDVVAHWEVGIGVPLVHSQAEGAIANIRAPPTRAGVVRVVGTLVSIQVFVRHVGLVGHVGMAHMGRYGAWRDIHAGGRSVVRAWLGVVVVEQVFLLLVADMAFAIPAGLHLGMSGLARGGSDQRRKGHGKNRFDRQQAHRIPPVTWRGEK